MLSTSTQVSQVEDFLSHYHLLFMAKKIKMLLIYYWNVSFQRAQGVVEHSVLSVLACLLRFEKITIVFACLFNKIPNTL